MAIDLSEYLVIGVSSRALFNLDAEDRLFREKGLREYEKYQMEHEKDMLEPGCAFSLVTSILALNDKLQGSRKTEVVIMSRNSAETSLRIFNSIEHYGLSITRAALSGGAPLHPYLDGFDIDLFLSLDEKDVRAAIQNGTAAAIVYGRPSNPTEKLDQIRIAFDGDSVLFSDESERVYQQHGLEAFLEHEKKNAEKPLPEGPFAKLLKTLSYIQSKFPDEPKPVRTALVTARNSPSHERVIRTLHAWNVDIDEAFFLGGVPKAKILQAFNPHMYFDDQKAHCEKTCMHVPTGRVPFGVASN